VPAALTIPTASELKRRVPRLLLGLVILGCGVTLLVRSDLGLAPWDVLHQGISDRTGVPIGTVGIVVGFPVLLGWLPLRQPLGVGTVINVLLVGIVIDVVLPHVPTPHALAVRIAFMVGGVVLMAMGFGFYIGAGLGAGPRDGLMTGIADRGHSLRVVRTGFEITVLVVGWLLGGTVGVGTLVFALTVGPLCHLFLERFAVRPLAPEVTETTGLGE
jgi:uncharacterized membrane protein YczE